MPTLEIPPNPATPPNAPGEQADPAREPIRVSTGRYGALDHTEIVRLLSTLDDEVARARFRESIYLSLFICLALGWVALFGPKYLWHGGNIVPVVEDQRKPDQLTYLEMPRSLIKTPPPKSAKIISEENNRAQTAHPAPKPPTPEELQQMRRAGNPGVAAPRPEPAPRPQAAPPQPKPAQPQPAPSHPPPQQTPLPSAPQPRQTNIPDAPKPNTAQNNPRPSFHTDDNAGQSVADAARAAAQQRGQGGENGAGRPKQGTGANTGLEVLSDTLGTDFGPYLKRLVRATQRAWEPLIPEECYPPLSRTGRTTIRFTILPNGAIGKMVLEGPSHDIAIDKAAWGAIISQGQLPPLPATFKGPYLELRFQFNIYHDGDQAQ
jgi:outer membrane biosynthesis protein TonB